MARNGRGLRHVFGRADYRWLSLKHPAPAATELDGAGRLGLARRMRFLLVLTVLALYLLLLVLFTAPAEGSGSAVAISGWQGPLRLAVVAQVPSSGQQGSASGSSGVPQGGVGKPGDIRAGQGIDFDSLIDLIKNTIAPESWDDAGGAGTISEFPGGVYVDSSGVLRYRRTGGIEARRLQQLKQASSPQRVAQSATGSASPFRKVSLTRLERAVARRLADGQPLSDEMRYLAGLTEVRHLFIYPDTGDIVIAGPAEPWTTSADGAFAWGLRSGKPTLQLDDFVTLLRVVSPEGPGVYACGIYPTRRGLAQVRQMLVTSMPGRTRAARERFLERLKQTLGPQEVRLWGVPATSRVALILVTADYHMKLVGIGLAEGGPHVPSYLELIRIPPSGKLPPLETLRWWFTPEYDQIVATDANDAFQLVGRGVRVQAENEFLLQSGHRVRTGRATLLNRQFARNFTEHFNELAERYAIYAELRNLFDLTTVATLIVNYELDRRVGWDHGVFAVGGAYRPAKWNTPRWVESVVNQRVLYQRTIRGGRRVRLQHVVTVISGGVVVNPWPAVKRLARAGGSPASTSLQSPPAGVGGPWWWD